MNQKDIIEDEVVKRYLYEIVGAEGMEVALSPAEGEVKDEEIAEDLDVDVNTVRRTLIVLDEKNLADYRRVRDQESGWISYYWTFRYERIYSQLKSHIKKLRDMLEKREIYEKQNSFYRCDICKIRYDFEESVSLQFTCPQCNSDLEDDKNDEIIELIRRRRDEIENELTY